MTAIADFRGRKIATRPSDLIGNTPLFQLFSNGVGSKILLKLEQLNPTGSCKVRMAREIVLAAERAGTLKKGGHIVEPTSGNTGIAIALMAIERGYKFTAIVDRHASKDKLRVMEAMGVNLIVVEGSGNMPSTLERRRRAMEISAETGAFWPDQHHNPNNNRGYYGLADELVRDLGNHFEYLVGSVGTGGTLCGTVKNLRALGCKAKVIGVEPTGSIIFGRRPGQYWQTGAGSPAGFPVGPNVDHSLIDEGVTVDDIDAFSTVRTIARRTGLLLGGTSGAAIYIALTRLPFLEPGSTSVVLVCDAGEKYLDTIYNDTWLEERGLLDQTRHEEIDILFDTPLPKRQNKAVPETSAVR